MCVTVLFAVSCRLPCRGLVCVLGWRCLLPTYLVETIVHFRIDWKQYEAQPTCLRWPGKVDTYISLRILDMRIWILISELREVDELDC